jgi:hypothetical protein
MIKKLSTLLLASTIMVTSAQARILSHSTAKVAKKASTVLIVGGSIGLVASTYFAPQQTAKIASNIALDLAWITGKAITKFACALPVFCSGVYEILGNGFNNIDTSHKKNFVHSCIITFLAGLGINQLLK